MSAIIGLSHFHVAVLTKDDGTGTTYDVPSRLHGAIAAKQAPKTNSSVLYGDDGPQETASTLGEIDVEIEVGSLSLSDRAKLLGGKVVNGMLVDYANKTAPYVALGFKAMKNADGDKYRYVWMYKGKFQMPEEDNKTKADKADFATMKIKATFVKREFDNAWRVTGDDEEAGFVGGANWFNTVQEPPVVPAP